MPRAVGLDLGRTSISVAAVDASTRRVRLQEFAHVELEPGLSEEDYAQEASRVLDRLFREHRLDRDLVIANLDPGVSQLRDITVPFKTSDQIDRIIRFEAEHHLHTSSIEDVIVDYVKVGEIGEKARLLLVAAAKDSIRERLTLLSKASIDPLDLDLDVLATYNAVAGSELAEEHPNLVIVDVGTTFLKIIVVEEHGLSHVRVGRLAAESVALPPSDPRSGDEDNLINLETQAAPAQSAASMATYLDRLVKEVRKTLMGIRLRETPEVILLCGAGSRLPGIAERIAAELELPCKDLSLAASLQHSLDPDQIQELDTHGSVALGLALKGAGIDRSGMSFRKEDLAFQRRFEQVRLYLLSMVMLVFLCCFVPAAYFYRLQRDRQYQYAQEFTEGRIYADPRREPDRGVVPELEQFLSRLENLPKATGRTREQLQSDLEKVKRAPPQNRVAQVNTLLEKYLKEVEERLGKDTSIPQIESALLVLAEVFKRLQEAQLSSPTISESPLRILDLDVTPREFSIEYWAPDVESHELVLRKLRLLCPTFFRNDTEGQPQFVGQRKEVDGGIEWTIHARRTQEED